MAHAWCIIKWFPHLQVFNLHYHTQQASDHITMALAFNGEHTMYYHMDALYPIGLM